MKRLSNDNKGFTVKQLAKIQSIVDIEVQTNIEHDLIVNYKGYEYTT